MSKLQSLDPQTEAALELPHLLAGGVSRVWEFLTRGQHEFESRENELHLQTVGEVRELKSLTL